MAGSWNHMVTKTGKFRGTRLLENLGDCYEALEQCYGMVQWLAEQIATEVVADRQAVIEDARQHSQNGIELGGRASKRISGA
jgi:hypothetical protein